MGEVKSHKAIPDSQISLRGKTISTMREIAKGVFMESFINIKLSDDRQSFIVMIEDNVMERTITYFESNYKQCTLKIVKEVLRVKSKR